MATIDPATTGLDKFDRLAMISRALTSDIESEAVVAILVNQTMAGTSATGAAVAFRHGDRVVPAASSGTTRESVKRLGPLTVSRDNSVCVAIRTGQPVWLPDRRAAISRFDDLRLASPSSQGWAAVPLMDRGRPFGALSLSFNTPPRFDPVERRFILAIADIAALALAREAAPAGAPSPPHLSPILEDLLLRHEAALVVDQDGVIVGVNHRLLDLVGFSHPDALVGRSVENLVPEADQSDHARWRRRYVDEPVPRPFRSGLDITIRPASGGPGVPVEVALSPFTTPDGTFVVAVVRERDPSG